MEEKTENIKKFRLPKDFWENKWKPALLSGNYSQGKGALYRNINDILTPTHGRFCCLGVAAESCGIELKKTQEGIGFIDKEVLSCFKQFEEIPSELIDTNELTFTLSNLNDQGYKFVDIVDWIEKHVELY